MSRKGLEEDPPPVPRTIELIRDEKLNFGFVAGSEKPVIVRFVKEGGPSEHLLQAGDQILNINGEDVVRAPREHVIELVKSCKHSVTLTVCQPYYNNSTRKSALLTAAKKAKLKSRPSRVRFAEGVVINASPLFCPMSAFESNVPFIANVLTVFLENGQTKTFKYDSSTTVQDVINSLIEKLSIKCGEHYSLVCEHIKAMRKNRLTLLDPKDALTKIAARPGAHNLRCLFRVMFVPKDAMMLLERDSITFEYLYSQCCNDVVQERFSPELKYEIALRLSALQLLQHSIDSNCMQPNGKVNLKFIERECGLESFIPFTLLESMKRKELHKLLNHFLKLNQQLCPTGQKHLNSIQAKLHYLKIMSELPSYGAKIFSLNIRDMTTESGLLVSPKFGISHVNSFQRNSLPTTVAKIEDINYIKVSKSDELYYSFEVQLKPYSSDGVCSSPQSPLRFDLEDRDAEEFVLIIRGYHRLFNKYDNNCSDEELPVFWDIPDEWCHDSVKRNVSKSSGPSYCVVREAQWSYDPNHSLKQIDSSKSTPRNMSSDSTQMSNEKQQTLEPTVDSSYTSVDDNISQTITPNGIDMPSLVSMEILESQASEPNIKSDDVIKRVSEMNKIVADAQHYLADEVLNGTEETVDKDSETSDKEIDEMTAWNQTQPFQPMDSLLRSKQTNGNNDNSANDKQNGREVINGESSANESDTDSLMSPNESPLHRINLQNSMNALQLSNGAVTVNDPRPQETSFGLHSPDIYSNMSRAEQDLMESLKQLRSEADFKLKFSKDIDLELELIDLTAIPPPDTPDELEFMNSSMDFPMADDPPTPYKEDIDFTNFTTDDSARVVAELDDLCDTLSVMKSTASEGNSNTSQNMQYTSQDIDDFIESMTVRPPPPDIDQLTNDEHYLSSFIIPPPPSASPSLTRAQDDVIAKFWRVTDDIRKMCANDNESPRLFKREVHSSSSGESGYDSAFPSVSFPSTTNDWPVFTDSSPKHSLPTVIEVNSSSESENIMIQKHNKKVDKTSNESSSCEDLHAIRKYSQQMNDSNQSSPKGSPNFSRSQSWGAIPVNTMTTPSSSTKCTKPPIPPCSPSIQEKRRQMAMKSHTSPKHHHRSSKHSHSHHNGYHSIVDNTIPEPMMNGMNGCAIASEVLRQQTNEIFIQSQQDIDVLLARLEEVHDKRLTSSQVFECTENDFMAAKEALVTESRHFVTASKLFVKCATEASPQLLEYLLDCVTLLERMYSVGEIVLLNMESQAQITCLVDRLKEVAATYAYTVDTVHKLHDNVCSPSTSPYMGLLMNHATSLATSLSALMRTLRAMNL